MLKPMSEARKPGTGAVAGATVALVLLTAMNFVNYIDRYILPAVQEQIKGEFHITDGQIGRLVFWFMIAYMGSSPITGWLGDRFPRKPMIVIAALMISATNFLTSSVHSYDSLNLRHAMLGIGEACFGIFAPSMLADFYPEDQRNRVMTIFNIAIPVGAALGILGGGIIGQKYGWRSSFVLSAIPGALIALLVAFFIKEPERSGRQPEKAKVEKTIVMSLLTNPAYMCTILGYAAVTFSLGGISNWMVSFLVRVDGYTQAAASAVMGPIIVVAGLGGMVVGGVWAGWWAKRTPKAMFYVPSISAIAAVPPALLCFFAPATLKFAGVPATLIGLSVAVFLIFLGTGPVNATTLNSVRAEVRATAMAGQLLVIHLLGDMSSPALIGTISDHTNLRLGLSATLITMVIAGVIFFIGARYAPKLHHTLEASAAA
jgi:MFS transporter, Spinster family, sphingosine-1-phosphate transporter